nr:HAD family phosphatase [Bacilli bacterium]
MKDKLITLKKLKERIANTDYLFFDLDGTLIDTEPLYQRFWKEASKYYGYELSDEEELTFRSLDAYLGAIKIKEYSHGLLDYDQVKEMRIALMKEYFSNHEIIVKKDAIKFLKTLKEAGKHIFIVTANKVEKANNILLQTKLMPYVEGVISAKDVKRGKPYPDVFLY